MHKQWQRKQEVVEPPGSLRWECDRGCCASDILHNPSMAGRQLLCAAHQRPQGARGCRARGSSLLQDSKLPSLLSHAHHLQKGSASGTKSLCLLRDHHSCWWQPHSPPLHTMMGPRLRDRMWPNVGSTRCSESGSSSTLLFKVSPPRATHTTSWVKFREASPRLSQPLLHSLPFTMEAIPYREKLREEEWQQECRQMSISKTSVNHRAQRRRARTGNNF